MLRNGKKRVGFSSVALVLAGLIVALPPAAADAKDSVETVSKGSPDVFIKKIPGETRELPPEYKATDTKYFLHVPDDYKADRAYPLMLAISPGPDGSGMFESWTKAAEKYKFIFACPNDAGNGVDDDVRGQRVVDTLFDVRSKYNVDAGQIYVTGFSGGGRMSTAMVMAYPDFFAGHIPIGGIVYTNYLKDLEKLKTRLGHYIFSGETCMNRRESEQAKQVFDRVKIPAALMIGPGVGHSIPNADQGVVIYEWFLAKTEPALTAKFENAQKAEKAGQLGVALKAYEALAAAGSISDCVTKAGECAKELREQAAKCIADAKNEPSPEAIAALKKLAKSFEGTDIGKEASELSSALEKDPRTAETVRKRLQEKQEIEAQKMLKKAEDLEKSGKRLQALSTYEAVVKQYPDAAAKEKAAEAVARLSKDAELIKEKNEADAIKLCQYGENLLRNGMTEKAKKAFEEVVQKYPDTEAARKAQQKAAEIK